MGKSIPAYVNRAAYLGSFLSCLLPSDSTAQAPVGDPSAGGSQASASGQPRRSDFIYSPFAGKCPHDDAALVVMR